MVSEANKEELIERIIDLAESVNNREADPFEVDINDFLERLNEIFSEVDDPNELLMDIEAMQGISDIISQQEDWIKHKSSLLHFDPMLVTWKVRELSKKQLAYVLINSWHPIVEMESMSVPGVKEAIEYWEDLEPLSERGTELETEEKLPEQIDKEDLSEFGFESKEDFDEKVEEKWRELKKTVGDDEEISYWEFVDDETFRQTIKNAWLTSFLVSYGYATLELNPLEDKIKLKPREERNTTEEETGTSVPISLSYEEWKKRRENNE